MRARELAATTICALALFAVTGCGSSDEKFASDEADRALAALDALQEYVDEGRCNAAESRVRALAVQSTRVNRDRPELGEAWASSVARLQELVVRECVEIREPTSSTGETGETGPTEEPTGTPEPEPQPQPEPEPEPTGGGQQPGQPPGNGGNENPGDSGGASPQ